MGFSGGGSNVLKPHTHDGTVVQDGGSLNMDNVTQASLTAGDIVYSDGSHLQRLAIGTPAQQIQVNEGATAPEYFTPAAGASTWTIIDEQTVAGTSIDTGSHAAADSYNMLYFSCAFDADVTNAPEIQWYDTAGNLMTGAYYQVCGFYNNALFQQINTSSALLTNSVAITAETVNIQMWIFNKKIGGNACGTYNIATRANGGTGSIYNKDFSGGTAAAIRGFKLIAPATIDNAFYVFMGA